jgi:biopolymer transport protein ExbB/TolQ
MTDKWPAGFLLQQWLLFAAATGFAIYIAWDYGLITQVVAGDITRLSIIILLIFAGGLAHGAQRAANLSRELDRLYEIAARVGYSGSVAPVIAMGRRSAEGAALVESYLGASALSLERQHAHGADVTMAQTLTDVFHDRINASYEFGWFVTNLCIRLGLLGTVVGFILMLRSAVVIDSIEFSTVQALLSEMTSGMGVALNTTLVGLVASAVLSIQYLWLDYGARRLVADAVFFVERDLTEGIIRRETPAPTAAV